jgi:hypothetical protein
MEKKICSDCGIERNETDFYLSRTQEKKRLNICKDCMAKELYDADVHDFFIKYNIPYIKELIEKIPHSSPKEFLGTYMRYINSLPQYKNMQWKDSNIYGEEETENNDFYNDIVENLRIEAKKLNDKLNDLRNKNDMNLYISTLKSLRETLDLISKYDWKLNYSEYQVKDDNDNLITQISVWEQNHDNQIRNHKFWNVVDAINYVYDNSKKIKDKYPAIRMDNNSITKVIRKGDKTLENYLKENYNKNIIDHLIRVSINDLGDLVFYIHANGYSSDTLDFVVKENELININNTQLK